MATKKVFSPAQLAAQKKFAAMAKARAGKKKAASKKKPAKKTVKKKVAVTAPSRATGKAPSTRLKKRRTKNKRAPAGFYPNPCTNGYVVAAIVDGKKYYFDGDKSLGSKAKAARYSEKQLKVIAAKVAKGVKYHEGVIAERVTVKKR